MKNLDNMFIYERCTIIDALNIININLTGTAFVIDENKTLLGTITDGDIRRAIIDNIPLNNSIEPVYNKNCIYVHENHGNEELKEVFRKYIKVIPIIDNDRRVVNYIELKDYFNENQSKENPVIIMAGGIGTRLKPLTDDIPKPMLKIGEKPILQTIIEQFRDAGFKKILISVNYKYDVIENYFRDGRDFGVSINYIREDKRMGTAGAISLAKKFLDKPFFVINGDILTNLNMEKLLNYHISNNFDMTIGSRTYEMQVPYGVLNVDERCVTSLHEKPIYSFVVSGGIYVLNPQIIKYIQKNQYYDITQLIERLENEKKRIGSFPIEEYWMDIGRIEDYYKANEDIEKFF